MKFSDEQIEAALAANCWRPSDSALLKEIIREFVAERTQKRFRHIMRGTSYALVGEAELQTKRPMREGDKLTIYQHINPVGKLWARPSFEFNDGRFVRLAHE